jgi:hypothetical protein
MKPTMRRSRSGCTLREKFDRSINN